MIFTPSKTALHTPIIMFLFPGQIFLFFTHTNHFFPHLFYYLLFISLAFSCLLLFPLLFSFHFFKIADMKNSVADRGNAQASCAAQFIGNHIEVKYSTIQCSVLMESWFGIFIFLYWLIRMVCVVLHFFQFSINKSHFFFFNFFLIIL